MHLLATCTRSGISGSTTRILPIMSVVFVAFLVLGMLMPVLPLHVHDGLRFGTFVVGLVAGSQFAASLVTRPFAGHYADRRGAKRGVAVGLILASLGGAIYLASLGFERQPSVAVALLLIGRGFLGAAESFVITAGVSWGLALVDPRSTGRVIAMVGSAMFAAFAIGAPTGAALHAAYGFGAVASATLAMPLFALVLVYLLPGITTRHSSRSSFLEVIGTVWIPGLGSGLGSVGFGAVATFAAILFANRGWANGWSAYTAYAVAFVVARMLFGGRADAVGGARVAFVCAFIEALGLTLIWIADRPEIALAGAALTGFGFSLVYPAFGLEAVRSVPSTNRGLAMGAYTAFLDLSQGIASPALGLIADGSRPNVVFLVSAATVASAVPVAFYLMRPARKFGGSPS